MNQILYYVNQLYYEDVDMESLMDGAFKGIMEQLDPHSIFISAKDQENIDELFTMLVHVGNLPCNLEIRVSPARVCKELAKYKCSKCRTSKLVHFPAVDFSSLKRHFLPPSRNKKG